MSLDCVGSVFRTARRLYRIWLFIARIIILISPNHLMAFCPQCYFASVNRTWEDPLVFQELDTNADALKQWVFQQIPKASTLEELMLQGACL